MEPFEILEHTADVGIAAHGATLEDLFANAAYGMFSIVTDLVNVEPREPREITATAADRPGLLVAFLSELLYRCEVDRFLTRRVEVTRLTDTELTATAHGEPIGPQHALDAEIKAVTRHELTVEKRGDAWHATVLFDI
ncbi:MAG: archease [Planctomycetota bacterium]